jgi:hypothetical protein
MHGQPGNVTSQKWVGNSKSRSVTPPTFFSMTSRNWIFTWNNPTLPDGPTDHRVGGGSAPADPLESAGPPSGNPPGPLVSAFERWKATYLCYQLERGKCGTLHVQGYIEMASPVRFKHFWPELQHSHFEKCKRPEKARLYCMKEDTRIEGPWEHGSPSNRGNQGHRSDLDLIYKSIREGRSKKDILFDDNIDKGAVARHLKYIDALIEAVDEPTERDVKCTFHYGTTGTGKTHACYSKDAYFYDPANGFWNNYNGQTKVILDDITGDEISYRTLLRILDKYPTTCNVKGSFKQFRGTEIHITSNFLPNQWYSQMRGNWTPDTITRRFTKVVWHVSKEEKREFSNYTDFIKCYN